MSLSIFTAAGGIGLFLMGMLLLTEGLRALAGEALRRFLRNSTRTPIQGAMAGAIVTAVLQSSSATTVATVGFVGAGLITFAHSLGIIFGANVGTTITGWLVAVVGFKLKLGVVLMPVCLLGVLMRLFGQGRVKHVGWALAGFSLLFIGIAMMQQGMAFMRDIVSPDVFPSDTFIGRLQLVGIGVGITLVTQSSSAGIAAALAALTAGAISFQQAAAMVIGMDVGTTVTAALATVGGSVATRRTGYAHVIYNIMTGCMAFSMLYPLGWLVEGWKTSELSFDPQLSLVAFHSTFNFVGVVISIGLTQQFARLIVWLIPESSPQLTARLDKRLLADPSAAVDAATATIADMMNCLVILLKGQLGRGDVASSEREMERIRNAEEKTRRYLARIRTLPENAAAHMRHEAAIHALDHLIRLRHRCNQATRLRTVHADERLGGLATDFRQELELILDDGTLAEAEQRFDELRQRFRTERRHYREATIASAAAGDVEARMTHSRLDSVRWLHRTAYHVWRIVHHTRIALGETPQLQTDPEPEIEMRDI